METTTREIIRKNKKTVKTAGAAAARHGAAVSGPIMWQQQGWKRVGWPLTCTGALSLTISCCVGDVLFSLRSNLWPRGVFNHMESSRCSEMFKSFCSSVWMNPVCGFICQYKLFLPAVPHRSTLCCRHHQCVCCKHLSVWPVFTGCKSLCWVFAPCLHMNWLLAAWEFFFCLQRLQTVRHFCFLNAEEMIINSWSTCR